MKATQKGNQSSKRLTVSCAAAQPVSNATPVRKSTDRQTTQAPHTTARTSLPTTKSTTTRLFDCSRAQCQRVAVQVLDDGGPDVTVPLHLAKLNATGRQTTWSPSGQDSSRTQPPPNFRSLTPTIQIHTEDQAAAHVKLDERTAKHSCVFLLQCLLGLLLGTLTTMSGKTICARNNIMQKMKQRTQNQTN